MPRIRSLPAAIGISSLIAGPVTLLTIAAATIVTEPTLFLSVTAEGLMVASLLFVASVPLGALAALLPLSLGAAAMYRLGRYAPETRSPLVWAGVGAVLGFLIGFVLTAFFLGIEAPNSAAAPQLWLGIPPATACALLCRLTLVWKEDC